MSENKEVKKPGFFTRAKNWIVALPARITGKVRREVSKWVFLHSPHRRRL